MKQILPALERGRSDTEGELTAKDKTRDSSAFPVENESSATPCRAGKGGASKRRQINRNGAAASQ